MRIVLPLLLFMFLAAPAKSGGDLRNADCWYGADGKLFHAQTIIGPEGNYVKADCAPTFEQITERPPQMTHTRAEWAQMLINKGRGPDFIEYSVANDKEPSAGGPTPWWAESYEERQVSDRFRAGTDNLNSETHINNAIGDQIGHPGGLRDYRPGGGDINVYDRRGFRR